MNRIDSLFKEKQTDILSIYFTAGYPEKDSTVKVIKTLKDSGADMIEIGIPFSDPLADGPVIQNSNNRALKNGMSLEFLFRQLESIRSEIDIPLILMGYLNPVIQFGVEHFCMKCAETGIDGVILPDLPPLVFEEEYSDIFKRYDLHNILLITPNTKEERIRYIDRLSNGFIYIVSSASVTGIRGQYTEDQTGYFKRVRDMNLKNPGLIGFGISDRDAFRSACEYASGGIIGSAFVKVLGKEGDMTKNIREFIESVR